MPGRQDIPALDYNDETEPAKVTPRLVALAQHYQPIAIMPELLKIATNVATPLALLGLVAALGYFAYARRLAHDQGRLESLPPEQRAEAADEYLTRYKIDGRDLDPADKLSLIKDEMGNRHRRLMGFMYVAAAVFVVSFVVAAIAYTVGRRADSTEFVNELDERARVTLEFINQKIAALEELEKEGADVRAEIRVLSESANRFPLLHKEYVNAIRDGDARLSHERHSRLKDFLLDPKLVAAMGSEFKPVYSMSEREDETGRVHEVAVRRWVKDVDPKGENVVRSYLAVAAKP